MSPFTNISLILVAAATWTAPVPAQTTWTVDDNGGADFVHIQDAVNAAQAGDVIAVHTGAYAAFVLDGKELVVHGLGPDVEVAGVVVVRNVAAGGQVEIDGLSIGATHLVQGEPALSLLDNQGTVRIVDCTVFGIDGGGCGYCGYRGYPGCGPFTQRGLRVETSLEAIFLRCTFVGGRAVSDYFYYYGYCGPLDGSDAVTVSDSIVSFFECSAQGGDGGNSATDVCMNGGRGGNGVLVGANSSFFADRSVFTGSAGGGYGCEGVLFPCCGLSGSPGASVRLDATASGTWKESTFSTPPVGAPMPEVYVTPYCLGTFEECPCGNAGIGLAGCENAAGTGGVLLRATGWPSVANDTLTLVATGLNPNASPPGLFFQGTLRENGGFGTVLHDGLLCATGEIIRLKGKVATAGGMAFGSGIAGDPPVSVRGSVPATGGTRFYQVWYRNQPAMFCPPAQFNMSNGVEVVWQP